VSRRAHASPRAISGIPPKNSVWRDAEHHHAGTRMLPQTYPENRRLSVRSSEMICENCSGSRFEGKVTSRVSPPHIAGIRALRDKGRSTKIYHYIHNKMHNMLILSIISTYYYAANPFLNPVQARRLKMLRSARFSVYISRLMGLCVQWLGQIVTIKKGLNLNRF
jgi:hypothetical protein